MKGFLFEFKNNSICHKEKYTLKDFLSYITLM